MRKEKRRNLIKHIMAWVFVAVYLGISDPGQDPIQIQIIIDIVFTLNYVWVFYAISRGLLPNLWERPRQKILFFLLLPIGILILGSSFVFIDYLIFYYFIPGLGGTDYFLEMPLNTMIRHSSTAFIMVLVPSILFYFNRKHTKELEKKNLIEKQLIVSELNFLKNQFHDHIIFNFLTHVYNKTYKHSMETADAIEIFSDMLRYSMQIRPDEKCLLSKEIEYIKNFIEIQKILTTQVNVNFSYQGIIEEKFILPRILITFVENAFKHGVFNDPSNPIIIDLNSSTELTFLVRNKKSKNKNIISHRVGLENFKQILELFYPNQYKLQIQENNDEYFCQLNLAY